MSDISKRSRDGVAGTVLYSSHSSSIVLLNHDDIAIMQIPSSGENQ